MNGRKILIVDDDVRNVYALSSYLEADGMEVITADGGKDAMDVLEAEPDIGMILMDIVMPDMDGYEAIRKLRTHPRYKHIPILAVTASTMEGDREKCLRAGADNYISKPVDVVELKSKIKQLANNKR